jgi:DNA-binding NtrC family response regulator
MRESGVSSGSIGVGQDKEGNPMEVLIVSCRTENKKSLMQVFVDLPLVTHCVSNIEQARDFLCSHAVPIIFCEDRLPDGTYRELLSSVRSEWPDTRFVVVQCLGEWEEYLEALHLGADEVVKCPLEPTDVDLAIIRIFHENSAGYGRSQSSENEMRFDRA